MTMFPGYAPDPPSPPEPSTEPPTGTTTTPNPFSHILDRPGYVSHVTYTVPPVWFVGSERISTDEVRLTAQRYANESGVLQIIDHGDDAPHEIIRPEVEV